MSNLRSMVFMIMGMATFAGADAMIKLSSSDTTTGLIMITMGLAGGSIFLALCVASGTAVLSRLFFNPVILLRNLFEVAAAFFLFQAFALNELSTVAAILQAIPLILTILAAVFLNEKVGPRRWTAVAIGLLGVLIIIRPTGAGIGWTDLLAVLGTLFLALRDLASRLAPPEASTPLLSVYAFMLLVPTGAMLNFTQGGAWHIAPGSWGPLSLMVVLSVTGYYCVTTAMRIGDVSAVSPLRYFRLPCAAILAYFLFSEVPDWQTILGATLVVGSGLFVMLREAQLSSPK